MARFGILLYLSTALGPESEEHLLFPETSHAIATSKETTCYSRDSCYTAPLARCAALAGPRSIDRDIRLPALHSAGLPISLRSSALGQLRVAIYVGPALLKPGAYTQLHAYTHSHSMGDHSAILVVTISGSSDGGGKRARGAPSQTSQSSQPYPDR